MSGLRARVLLVCALATLVPTILVGGLAVRRARLDVEREVLRGNLALVRALGGGLDAVLQDARRTLTLAAAGWADDPSHGARAVRRLKREVPILRQVALLDADGKHAAGDVIELAGRFEPRRTYGGYVSEVRRNAAGVPGALLVVQARGRTGELAGYAAAELDLGFVDEALRGARPGPGARLWVIDADGHPIGTGTGAGEPPDELGAAALAALAEAEEGSLETDDQLTVYRNLASLQTVRGVSWSILLAQPTADAYRLARATTRDTLLAGGVVLALALALGFFLSAALTRPLARLAERVSAFGRGGRVDTADLAEAPGEIGLLARRFAEMAARLEERERLEKLATVGALAAGVAHEINNPLQTILGYAHLLVEDAPPGADRERLELVVAESRRVQGIVRTLLDHARLDPGPLVKERVDLAEVCRKVAALIAPTARQRGVEVEVTGKGACALGDARRLEQVGVNLAQNAVHAMAEGGTLTLSAEGSSFRVSDTGPGIPADKLHAIFEPFFTTKGPGVGTGLGLAIARQIVEDHDGRIEVTSAPGAGSTFRVVLPPWTADE